jgi:hypothetical protein
VNLYDLCVSAYNGFIGIFPGSLQWLITLLILIGLIGSLIALIRHHIIFLLLIVILLPFAIPVVVRFVSDIAHFVHYLGGILGFKGS